MILQSIKKNKTNILSMLLFAPVFILIELFFHEAGHYKVEEMYNLNPEFNFLVKGDAGNFKFAEATINPDTESRNSTFSSQFINSAKQTSVRKGNIRFCFFFPKKELVGASF